MIILRGRPPVDDYFKRPAPPDDHLQEAGPLWMIICKRPAPPDEEQQQQQQQQQQQAGEGGGGGVRVR